MHKLQCAEIWGGIEKESADVSSPNIIASLFSSSGSGIKGGDIYYLTLCNSSYISRMVIADIAGHGEEVSEVSLDIYETLKKHVDNLEGRTILDELNHKTISRGVHAMATAAIATYYRYEGSFSFVYAGHPPILFKRKDNKGWQTAKVSNEENIKLANIPLGVDLDAVYLQDSVVLKKTDRFLMYTDGLLETVSPENEAFGLQRLLHILDEHENKSLEGLRDVIIEKLFVHANGELNHDDVTLLLVEVQ